MSTRRACPVPPSPSRLSGPLGASWTRTATPAPARRYGAPEGVKAPKPPRPFLTPAQLAVVALAAQGLDNAAIAARRDSAVNTVKVQMYAAGSRLGSTRGRAATVAAACQAGLLDHLPVERQRPDLPPRLLDTLHAIANGLTDEQIADKTGKPVSSVKSRVKVLYAELAANGRAHAVLIGWQLGLWDGGQQ